MVGRALGRSNTNTPQATSDVGTCLSAGVSGEEVKDNQHKEHHLFSFETNVIMDHSQLKLKNTDLADMEGTGHPSQPRS